MKTMWSCPPFSSSLSISMCYDSCDSQLVYSVVPVPPWLRYSCAIVETFFRAFSLEQHNKLLPSPTFWPFVSLPYLTTKSVYGLTPSSPLYLNNSARMLSGPGDFPQFILFSASFTSDINGGGSCSSVMSSNKVCSVSVSGIENKCSPYSVYLLSTASFDVSTVHLHCLLPFIAV